jgi:hypothetical protein
VIPVVIRANYSGKADKRYITATEVGAISIVPDAVSFKATVLTIR